MIDAPDDAVPEPTVDPSSASAADRADPSDLTGRRGRHVVAASAVTALAVASLFHVEIRAADFDPQYARNIVERTARFGGSYYVNGIHNKGPLEPAMYALADRFTSYDGFWFGIAVFVMIASTVVGLAARRVVTMCGGPEWLGWSAFGATYVHLTLSGADYAGVLYSRNMTVTLLAIAFLCVSSAAGRPTGRRRIARLAIAGGAIGLAVQTLQTAALTGTVLLAFALLCPLAGAPRNLRERSWFVGAAAVVFVSAPLYYAAFGPWRDFWNGWWTYGRYMTAATDRSLGGQLGLGWHEFYLWSTSHAPLIVAIGLFVALGVARWRQLPAEVRGLQIVLPAWWVAAWFEIILTQRYSSHYFVVTAVPAAMMVAGLGWHVVDLLRSSGARVPGRGSVAASTAVAATVVLSIVWSGTGPLIDGLQRASEFDGVESLARERAQARDGSARSVQAVLDMVSEPADPMLAWTNEPWPYLDFHRVSATRFIWKSFLMGEIYLGRTGLEFVLPGSWERWQRDVEMSRPTSFLVDRDVPVPADTPAGALLANEFVPALETPAMSLALRPRVVALYTDTSSLDPWQPTIPDDAPWTFENGTFSLDGSGASDARAFPLGDLRCRRWDAVVDAGAFALHFDDPSGRSEHQEIVVDGALVVSRSPNVDFLRTVVSGGVTRVSVVAGTDAVIVLADDRVVGALSLVSAAQVTLVPIDETVGLSSVGVGPAPTLGECSTP